MQSTNEQIEKITSTFLQSATEANNLLRDSVNATLQSVSIITKGCNDLSDSYFSLSQKYLEQSVRVSQSLLSSNSVNEFVDTQNNVLKNSFDTLVSDMSNITQLSTRIAQDAAKPVASCVNNSINKISKTTQAA